MATQTHIEDKPASGENIEEYEGMEKVTTTGTTVEGTTQLYAGGNLRCIPMPTADPKDPLNLPMWRKILIIAVLCFFGAIAIAAQQIMGSLLPIFVLEYAGLDPSILNGGIPAFPAGGIPTGGIPSGFSIPAGGIPSGLSIPGGIPTGALPSGFSIPTGGIPTGAIPSGVSIPAGISTGAIPSGVTGFPTGSLPSGFTIPATATGPIPTAAARLIKRGAIEGLGIRAVNPNPLSDLANIPNAPPLWRVNMLSSLPLLIVGLSNYVLVPASIIFGRRPVLIICALLSWVCCIWAGYSHSLNSHLAARCVQALGAGAVESLIPLVVQDMTFINQRNRGIGVVWASQGIVTVSLGIGSSYIVSRMGWRWLYYILAIITAVSWLLIILFVPETRWRRSSAELRGQPAEPLQPGEIRPTLDPARYGNRTLWTEIRLFNGGIHWKAGGISLWEIAQSLIFPNVVPIILLNSVFIGVSLASSQALTPVLLAAPYSWPFEHVGLSVIAIVISTIFVYLIGGFAADRTANYVTKKRNGRREPEVHLWSLLIPVFIGILGCVLFGVGGSYSQNVSWATILIGVAMLNFGFLSTNVIGSVYCIESYPEWAGPVLVNVASFRNIIGFAFSFGVTDWIEARGYIGCFGIYAGVIALLSLGIPFLMIFGKRIRKSAGARVKKTHHSD